MIARKCDRCKNFYDEYNGAIENNEGANSIRLMNMVKCGSEYHSAFKNEYDLCPNCVKSLINWLNMAMTEVKK